MTLQSDQMDHRGLELGQLVLFGAATIVLLFFAWTYVQ
jgi:hypothetical protein